MNPDDTLSRWLADNLAHVVWWLISSLLLLWAATLRFLLGRHMKAMDDMRGDIRSLKSDIEDLKDATHEHMGETRERLGGIEARLEERRAQLEMEHIREPH